MITGLRLWVGTAALALAFMGSAAAAEAFDAHGSAEQVYATGTSAGQQMALLDSSGHVVQTKAADSLGGVVFRNVAPGDGYRVRAAAGGPASDPLTVLSTRPAPPSTDVYNQSIPSSGY